jgi:hypothetical protein
VYLEFDKDKLLCSLGECKQLRAKPVIYKDIKGIRNQALDLKELDIPIDSIRRPDVRRRFGVPKGGGQ